ncbi:hypothetical protein B5X24_HaOG211776 [Helicoverpa armigera]|uniref:Uncharacterized protein n=1 Tax=Helicoverpa armigera TaxID=29058 RepID=A0A2W1BH95_HELAM|nr:hypothetical protein B5X24_HaOG211776 [Helicoverpa armigera]
MNSHKNTGLPSFIPSNTPGNKKPSKSQNPDAINSHDNKSTTVNLYELFGLPSPSPTRATICPGSRHIRRYSSKYPKKKKPDFPEPTGYELSSEDLVPRKKVKVFPPILFSSEVIPQNYFPPYKQIELSTPRTVNSYSEESLRNFPTFQNILTSQAPKKSPTTYRIDRTLSSGTRKTATSKRKLPTSTYRPIFLRGVDITVSSGVRKTVTSQRKPPSSTHRPIFLRGVDRTVRPDVTVRSKRKSLASTKNTNDKKIRVHRVCDKCWHSLTVKDVTPRLDVDRRRQIIHKPKTRKIRSRLLNRKLRTSNSSPRVTLQGISSSSVPKSLKLEDHDSMVSKGRPVLKAYEKKIADIGMLHKVSSPYQRFEDMMTELHEGYLPVFLMELVRLIAAKQPSVVYNVVGHTNSVLTELFKRSDLRWFGQPLRDVTISIGRYLAQTDIDGVRSHARTLHNLLHARRSSLPAHVNSIIDAASLLYEPLEGYALFDSLMDFEKYPDIPRTGRQVCADLIKSFLRPFRRLHHSKRCQELLISIDDALATRFSSYRLRIFRSSEDSDEENQSRSMKYVFKRTRKNKRRQRRRHKPYRNESPNRRQVETFKLERMKPTTKHQKQLSIILPKNRRGMLRIDSSSYSDEEEALKSNLVKALMQGNGSAVEVRENSAVMGDDAVEKSVKGTEKKLIIQSSDEIPRTGRQVCQSLIKSFLRPFRRLHHSKQCQELLISINDELATSFSSYRLRILRSSGDSDEENQSRSMKYVFKRTRKNKRRQRRRHKPYRNESPNRRQVEKFKLRRMKPTTEQQKQLSIILPKNRRGNTHTNAQFQDKKTRKTIDYSHTQAKQFLHDDILGADDGKLLDRSDLKAGAKGMISAYLLKNRSEESRSTSIKARLKTGMLRIDSSSYSDDEEALKNNLVQALMQGNGSAVDGSQNSAVMGDDAVESVKDTENKLIIQSSEESHFLLKDKK